MSMAEQAMALRQVFDVGYSIKRVCLWCGHLTGLVTCRKEQHGEVEHGVCDLCAENHFAARRLKMAQQFEK